MNIMKMCRCSLIAAVLFVLQVALSGIPNGELVSVTIIAATMAFGWEMALTVEIFALLEMLMWGFGIWNIMYLYVWLILVAITMLFRKLIKKRWYIVPVISALYGLSFGALCTLPYIPMFGWTYAITWWANGVWFDVMHAGWNFGFGLIGYLPLYKVFKEVKRRDYNV